jgi:hypothetical protein
MIALSLGILTGILSLSLAAQSAEKETPFYCNLKALSSAERSAHQAMTKRLLEAVRGIREVADGYAFDLDSQQVAITDLAAWVAFEQRCCPFFDFRVEWHRENGPLTLQLAGREGVKPFIRTEFAPAFQ